MNFYQAPVTRLIHTDAKDQAVYAIPPAYDENGVVSDTYLKSGRAVTVFFETPGWPSAASKIEMRTSPVSTAGALTVAPNTYLSNADSYLFIRGNSVYGNNSTTDIHVVYCATIAGVVPSEARKALPNNYWIQPGDTFDFNGLNRSGTNKSTNNFGPGVLPIVTAVRTKGSPQDFYVEFSVPINTSVVGAGGTFSVWADYELKFFNGVQVSATDIIGLAKDQLRPTVTSSTNWTGTMVNPVNLSYPAANKAGIVPPPDPSKFLITSKEAFKANGAPHHVQTVTKNTAHSHLVFEQLPDYNQGFTPYRCISFYDWSSNNTGYMVELTIHPVH